MQIKNCCFLQKNYFAKLQKYMQNDVFETMAFIGQPMKIDEIK